MILAARAMPASWTIHYLARFGSAIMLSIVGGFSQFLSGYGQNNTMPTAQRLRQPTPSPVSSPQHRAAATKNQANLQARQIAAQNVFADTNQYRSGGLEELHQHPTDDLSRPGHANCRLRAPDLDFSSLYPDPVKEALRELKRERTNPKSDRLPR